MPLLSRKRLILLKSEALYATDATPTGTDALLVRNLDITPISGDLVSRDLVRPYLGNSDQLIANTKVELSFEVELAGSGTAGTAPRYGAALKACGLAEVIVASTSVTYSPVSSNFGSATIYFNADGLLHKVTGCRGTFTMNCQLNQIPVIQFQMTGIYNSPTDTAAPTVTYGNQATPLIFRAGNTTGFQILSYSACLMSVDFNIANSVTYRELVGCSKEVLITDRKPAGSAMIETPTIAQKDFFTASLATATGALAFTHGTAAGNRVTFTAPAIDISNPTYGESDGVLMLNLPYVALPTSPGNNEVFFAFD